MAMDHLTDAIRALNRRITGENDVSLKTFLAGTSISELCAACMGSSAAVLGIGKLRYRGRTMPQSATSTAAGLICGITMTTGAAMLLRSAEQIAGPVRKVTEAVSKIAEGDFSVRIEPEETDLPVKELQDLTEHFNKMAAQLDGMDYMRKDFTSNVAHEFKSPIAAIAGFSELLQEECLTEEERQEYLGIIREEAVRLSHLTENMLRMSRLDNTEIVTRKETVQVDEQIRRCLILLAESHPERAEDLEVDLCPVTLETDPDLLEQIWINLLDNAVKYSGEGAPVLVHGKCAGGKFVLSIADGGVGIPPEKCAHIFDRFYQCEESHRTEGNGLGLSIVRRIVELLGGSISCDSTPGEGTCFTVVLPLNDTKAPS